MRISQTTRRVLIWAAFVAAYGAAVHIGLRFVVWPEGIALFWPASGLALAALLLRPRREWRVFLAIIFVAHAVTNALSRSTAALWPYIALANTAEPALAAWVMTRLCGERIAFTRLADVLALIVAAAVTSAGTALLGAAALSWAFSASFWAAWKMWLIADGLGILLVTPLVVTWACSPSPFRAPLYRRVEFGALLTGLVVITAAAFGHLPVAARQSAFWAIFVRPYLLFPFLVWAGIRFRPRGAATALGVAAVAVLWSADPLASDDLLSAQVFLSVAALSTLTMAAVVQERHEAQQQLQARAGELATQHQALLRTTEALRASEERYRSLFTQMSEGFALHEIICDESGRPTDYRFLEVNPAFERLTGLSAAQTIGRTVREILPGIEPFWIEVYGQVALTGRPTAFEQYALQLGRYYRVVAFSPQPGQFAVIFADITARKQAEEALRRRERDFSTLVENATDMIVRFDADLRHIYCNPAVERQLGIPVQTFLGKTVLELDEPRPVLEFIDRALRYVLETGEESEVEQSIPTPFGVRHFQTHITPERDAEGKIESLLAVTRDITERRRVEEALRASEARFRQLADSIGDVFLAVDRDLRCTYWNQAAEALMGIAAGDAIGRSLYDLFPDLAGSPAEEFYLEALRTGRPQHFVNTYPLTGEAHFFETSVYPTPEGVSVLARDVTARVEAERARLRAENLLRLRLELIEYAASQTVEELLRRTLDAIGSLVASPISFYHLLAEDERTIVARAWSTRTLQEFCQAESREGRYDLERAGVWADAIRERRAIVHNDYATLPGRKGLPPGHPTLTRELIVPIFRQGRIVAVLGVGNKSQDYTPQDVETVTYLADVTCEIVERKQAEEKIVRALAEKETLLRELYHRTKNNMQVICALLELQSDRIQDADILNIFREMENRIQSMALVHQMLYRSQSLSSIDLRQYIEELLELLMSSYGFPIGRVRLKLELESVPVLFDIAIPCGLLLNELFSNALRHAFPDGRSGEIHVRLRREEDGFIALTVSDDGVGLPAGFDFRQSDSLGMQIITLLGERQLRGQVMFTVERGVTCQVRFRDVLYAARV